MLLGGCVSGVFGWWFFLVLFFRLFIFFFSVFFWFMFITPLLPDLLFVCIVVIPVLALLRIFPERDERKYPPPYYGAWWLASRDC